MLPLTGDGQGGSWAEARQLVALEEKEEKGMILVLRLGFEPASHRLCVERTATRLLAIAYRKRKPR